MVPGATVLEEVGAAMITMGQIMTTSRRAVAMVEIMIHMGRVVGEAATRMVLEISGPREAGMMILTAAEATRTGHPETRAEMIIRMGAAVATMTRTDRPATRVATIIRTGAAMTRTGRPATRAVTKTRMARPATRAVTIRMVAATIMIHTGLPAATLPHMAPPAPAMTRMGRQITAIVITTATTILREVETTTRTVLLGTKTRERRMTSSTRVLHSLLRRPATTS